MEKRNYTIGEYILSLTEAEKESIEKLVNLFSETKFELLEVKEKIDEREETIKSIKCYMQNCNKELEDCWLCKYNSSLTQHRVNVIALKHIQGYKNVMKWINEERIEALKNGNYYLANNFETFEKAMEEEFDISEVE